MRYFLTVTATVIAALVLTTTAAAKYKPLCYKAHGVREAVVKKYGGKAAGRNICREKLLGGMTPTTKQKARYLRALKALNAPAPAHLAKSIGMPKVMPARTYSVSYTPTGLASCIVHHESRGDTQAQNGQYKGLAQWSPEAWARHGGLKYAGSPHGATRQEQLLVLSAGLSVYGCRDWCPFDGCG